MTIEIGIERAEVLEAIQTWLKKQPITQQLKVGSTIVWPAGSIILNEDNIKPLCIPLLTLKDFSA